MKWPWNGNHRRQREEDADREVRLSEQAVGESDERDLEVRRIQLEAMELISVSRKLANENHFGEMIDEALGLSHRRHA